MRTILISGSDTGIGKTHVVASLARLLGGGESVQILKPIETGVTGNQPGDAESAGKASGLEQVTVRTLRRFPDPVAPLTAAKRAGKEFSIEAIIEEIRSFPKTDWRLIETAGGIAVPLEEGGKDWCDFARALRVDFVVLVVPDRLGAINQARLTACYAVSRRLPAGIWLNEFQPASDEVRTSNEAHLAAGITVLWARQRHGEALPQDPEGVRNVFTA